jgi:DNA-binding XRE family transcriptional regulator
MTTPLPLTLLKPPVTPPNPSGLCMCGCGRRTPLAPQTHRKKGTVKGQPVRYMAGHNNRKPDYEVLANGCWKWLKHIDRDGYGSADSGTAHRLIWERHRGPVPEGRELHHICENRGCVNPYHLQPVTRAEHARLGSWMGGLTLGTGDGVAIRAARRRLNITQVELAALVGCSPSSISLIENGFTPGASKVARRVAAVLGVEA